MHQATIDTMMQATRTSVIVHHLIEDLLWLLIPVFLMLLVKSSLERMVEGLLWHLGRDYEVDDVVLYEGDYARIVRAGLFKTTFYIYHVQDDIVTYGKKLIVSNDELRHKRIEKQLLNHELPKSIKTIHQ